MNNQQVRKYSSIWQVVFKWGNIKLRIVEIWQDCMVCLIWADININMGWHYQAWWHQSQSCADCLEIPRQHSPFHFLCNGGQRGRFYVSNKKMFFLQDLHNDQSELVTTKPGSHWNCKKKRQYFQAAMCHPQIVSTSYVDYTLLCVAPCPWPCDWGHSGN